MPASKATAVLVVLFLAFPVLANQPPVPVIGNVTDCQSASLLGAPLRVGSTIFTGDSVQVNSGGEVRIALPGGGQIQIFEKSVVRFVKSGEKVEFGLDQGRAGFRSPANSSAVARIADATIQAIQGPATGLVEIRSDNFAYIAATKGTLEIRTEHDNSTLVLAEGIAATIPIEQEPAGESGDKNKSAGVWGKGRILLVTAAVLGAIVSIPWGLSPHKPACKQVTPVNCS
jgi:ferric-dicitrate binding protein FerR (iron transport regulator)